MWKTKEACFVKKIYCDNFSGAYFVFRKQWICFCRKLRSNRIYRNTVNEGWHLIRRRSWNKSFRLLNYANGQKSPPAPFGAGGFSSPKIQWQPQPPLQPPQSRSKATRITPLPSASVISCCISLSLSRLLRSRFANFLSLIKNTSLKILFPAAGKKWKVKISEHLFEFL